MSDDEPEFNGPEDEGPDDEYSDGYAEEEEARAWAEIAEQAREQEEHMSEIAEKEFGETEVNPKNILDIIKTKSIKLANPSIDNNEKEKLEVEIQELFDQVSKKSDTEEEKIEYDRDFNAYAFSRAASILSLESSWPEIRLKMDLLVNKIAITSIEYDKISALRNVIDTFENDYIKLIIDSEKPKTKNQNDSFESKIFHRIIIDSRQLFADFHDVFISDVTFIPNRYASSTQKFRAYMLDLRSRKKDKSKEDFYTKCYLTNGLELSKENDQKGSLYQGYWLVDYMLTELRNHVEHWKKGDETRKYLKNDLNRERLFDPITNAESPGNFFISISVLFLISYFFIEIMQTWVDTDEFLK